MYKFILNYNKAVLEYYVIIRFIIHSVPSMLAPLFLFVEGGVRITTTVRALT